MGDLGSIPGSGKSPGEGNGNQLQCSSLENPMDGGGWLQSTEYSPWGCQESNMTERPTHTWSFSTWHPRPWGHNPGLLVQSLCSPGIRSSPGGQSQISCEWVWCRVAAEGGSGRGKTGTKDENYVVYTKLASLMAHIKESACQCIPPQEMLKHSSVSVSVGSLSPGAHKLLF